jgi:hypothetical protein
MGQTLYQQFLARTGIRVHGAPRQLWPHTGPKSMNLHFTLKGEADRQLWEF